MTNPIFAYDHADGCTSITGGAFVPNGVWPGYDRAYVYGDYVCGKLFVLRESGGTYASTEFSADAGSPVDILFGPYGSTQALYYTNYVNGEQVRRIVYTGTANRNPTAAISASPTSGPAPLAVAFDASGSSDPDAGDTLSFRWDFGDGSPTVDTTTATTSHTYTSAGSFTASVVAIDNHGAASQPATTRIDSGNNPPQPSIDAPAPEYTFGVGDTITLRGSATDAEDGTLPGTSLTWTVLRHHNTHTHPYLAPTTGASVNIVGPEPEDVLAAANSYLEVFLTATDSHGLSKTVSMNIQPAKVDVALATNPSGLSLEVNGFAAPSTFVSWKNWAFTVNAPDQADGTGKRWTFASWSDGGARSHTIVTPASAAAYTATFAPAPAPAGLVAAYGFDDGSGTTATDSSGHTNTGTLSGATWTSAGRYGAALAFNGSSSKVVVPDAGSLDLTSALTVEAWVRPTALSAWRTIALKEREGGIVYSLYANEAGNRSIGQVDIGGEHNAFGTGLALDTWTHLAVTWDGSTLRLYVNGSLAGSTPVSGTLIDSSGPLDIGGNSVWGEYFSGLIDEVRVYNRALAAAEIQTDMEQPVGGGSPPSDTQPPTAPTDLRPTVSGNSVALTWGAAGDNVAVRRYHVHRSTSGGFTPTAANEIATATATTYTDTDLAAGTYFYKVTAEDTSGNVGSPSNEVAAAVSSPTSGNGLVAAYGFDEGAGGTTADRSGNGNTGTLNGGTAGSTSGHSGNALSFNGSTGRVSVADADSLDLTGALTLEAWVRPSALSGWSTVVLKERSGGIVYSLYANNAGDRPVGQIDIGGEQNAPGPAKLPLDTWTHLAATWDGTTLRLYVNGVESGSKAVSGKLVDSSGPLDIGGNGVWGEHFAGLIDDVRVYNRALTGSEVQSDMEQPIGSGPPTADTQPPTAPTNLQASVGGTGVTLTWSAATDNVGVRRYRVHRSTSSGFTPSPANEIGVASATTYGDTGLPTGTYYYKVTAEDTNGKLGPASAEVAASVEPSPPVASGLVASFGFDEGSGITTRDTSGNGNAGTLEGGTSWTTAGHMGSALSFNGVDSLVAVADAPSLLLAGPLTLEAWTRPTTVDSSYRTVVLKERSGGLCYALYADTAAGGPSGHVFVGGSEPRARAAIPLAANTWTHLAMTYDLTTIRRYVNGSLAASTPATGSVTASSGPLRIGGNGVWGEYFAGVIDDVRVYSRALSAVEIGADMGRPA